MLAQRDKRFLAALVDGLIGVALSILFWLVSGVWVMVSQASPSPTTYILMAGVYGFISFALVHYYFLYRNGQTVGKKLLHIRIVGTDDQLIGARSLLFKRYLPVSIVSLIPFIGLLLVLADILFIFRDDRRCVHDLIAGTKVVAC